MPALNYDNFMQPMKGQAAFSLKNKLDEYKKLYFELYAKELLVSCVYNKRYDRYTFFFKLPSAENDKYPTAIMYDIVIEFDPNKNKKEALKHSAIMNDYDIYVYSNSPSFVFTFDYVVKHKYGFPHCVPYSYLSKVAITKAPEIRNTFELMTIEKTTWMCFYHLVHNGYLTKELATSLISTNKDENFYMRRVETQPRKLKEVKDMQDLLKENRAKERAAKNKQISKDYQKTDNDNPMKYSFRLPDRKERAIMKLNNPDNFKKTMFKGFRIGGKK